MENNIGFKELYEVSLKTTFPMEMNGHTIEAGEKIAIFDKVLISTFDEKKNITSANGGYGNSAHIWWEETKELRMQFTQGNFSKEQLAIMTGAKLVRENESVILISKREKLETDEKGAFELQKMPIGPVFIYDFSTGKKITNFVNEDRFFSIDNSAFQEIVVDYQYNYYGESQTLIVGQNFIDGYLSLEGKTRVKDDTTGQVTTGIVKIPKLKLLSNLSMRLGKDAVPVVGRVDAVAMPDGERGRKKVMEIIFLDEDIDSDI